jgi:MFS family permease
MKPVFAMSQNAFQVFVAQSVERVGNGMQASPRDAFVADLSSSTERTKAFGFNKCLKTIGALFGVPIAVSILCMTDNNYRAVFAAATVAVVLAVISLLKVDKNAKIKQTNEQTNEQRNIFRMDLLRSFDGNFWKIIILAMACEAGHFSEHLLPLYANKFLSNTFAGTAGMFVSIGQVLFSIPMGMGADKFGKGRFIILCVFMIISANILFLMADSHYYVYLGCILWGGQITSVQSLFLSVISERVKYESRATAIGIYYCGIGISYLLASVTAGNLWTQHGCEYAFFYSISTSVISLLLFPILYRRKQSKI